MGAVMQIKFASRKVSGWANRHIDEKTVMRGLLKRQQNGFTLTSDEQQFWDDTISLYARYNDGKSILDVL